MFSFIFIFFLSTVSFASTQSPRNCFSQLTLRKVIECWTGFVAAEGSFSDTDYQSTLPSVQQREDFQWTIGSFLTRPNFCNQTRIPESLKNLYDLQIYKDQSKNDFCIFYENLLKNGKFSKGWGIFVIPLQKNWTRLNIHYSAAHPISDGPVHLQAAEIFVRTRGRSLLVTGTRRDASKVDSQCQPGNFRTDAAHHNESMFHSGLIAIQNYLRISNASKDPSDKCSWSNCVFIQFHGKANTSCSNDTIFLSTGYSGLNAKIYSNPHLPINRLKSSWRKNAPDSWTASTPDESKCGLTATTNIFGRLLNGVAFGEECKTKPDPKKVSGFFIHAEQAWEARDVDGYDVWERSIKDAFSDVQPSRCETFKKGKSWLMLFVCLFTMV